MTARNKDFFTESDIEDIMHLALDAGLAIWPDSVAAVFPDDENLHYWVDGQIADQSLLNFARILLIAHNSYGYAAGPPDQIRFTRPALNSLPIVRRCLAILGEVRLADLP